MLVHFLFYLAIGIPLLKSPCTKNSEETLRPSPFSYPAKWINENERAVAVRDIYPVSRGHTLVIPKRVVASVFELPSGEIKACWDLLEMEQKRLTDEFQPDGFNVGINIGEAEQ